MRAAIRGVPERARYSAERLIDHDGIGKDRMITVRVALKVADGRDHLRLHRAAIRRCAGYVNSTLPNTASSSFLALFMSIGSEIRFNEGALRALRVVAPEGTIVNALEPAPVTGLHDRAGAGDHRGRLARARAGRAGARRRRAGRAGARRPRWASIRAPGAPFGDIHFMCKGGGGRVARAATAGTTWAPWSAPGGLRAPDPELHELVDPFTVLQYEYWPDSAGAGEWRGGMGTIYRWRVDAPRHPRGEFRRRQPARRRRPSVSRAASRRRRISCGCTRAARRSRSTPRASTISTRATSSRSTRAAAGATATRGKRPARAGGARRPRRRRQRGGGARAVRPMIEVKPLYGPGDVEIDYERDLGDPGEFPFTRGVYPDMYRGRPWTRRVQVGFGTPQETNERLKYLLRRGPGRLHPHDRPADLLRLRLRRRARRGRGRRHRRGDPHRRGHGGDLRRLRPGQGLGVAVDPPAGQRGVAGDARAGRRAARDRRWTRVIGTQQNDPLFQMSGGPHADDRPVLPLGGDAAAVPGHHRVHLDADAAAELDGHQRLQPARHRRQRGAGGGFTLAHAVDIFDSPSSAASRSTRSRRAPRSSPPAA